MWSPSTARETVARALSQLMQKKTVQRRCRALAIPDRARLEHLLLFPSAGDHRDAGEVRDPRPVAPPTRSSATLSRQPRALCRM